MNSNWIKTMEIITVSMGVAIIVLGILYFCGGASIPPALVTGISIAGFCLTISDLIIKSEIGDNKFLKSESTQIKVVSFVNALAIFGVILFPNLTIIVDMDRETLDFISTSASVVALGFVIYAIGNNNRKEVKEDIIKIKGDVDEFLKRLPKLEKELEEAQEEALKNKNEVEELKIRLKEAQEELKGKNQ
ncbi:hypothetical protein V4483_25345 [Bacillus paranthracis]|uniref:hypothetical protein n=1 Tax=Bacillus TaxID=1386 RepID=UPI000C2A567E|nr:MULTISPECIES: hypothetical protein [Bacillus]MBL3848214.1 hypothetical protein [Bacillus cereus]MBR9747638.1 hypothetical protein [Bacillus cereus]MDA1647577.1 hypothetical protein [Bacillus cereus group sp. TH163-1LC]MDA1797385.1 hypothetical protein [Bacillus cereus group sp. BY8-1LC]MDA1882791.1 hypothetical protein [Bacillus cereus group sp. BY10-2LC]